MTPLDDLRALLRQTRAGLLAAIHGLPEAMLFQPGAVGPWSVAQVIAHRIEAENRALTLAQSMLHGRPFVYELTEAEFYGRDVLRRRDWDWGNLLREFFQQREETNWNLDWLTSDDLLHPRRLGDHDLSVWAVLYAEVQTEAELARQLWVWRSTLAPTAHD